MSIQLLPLIKHIFSEKPKTSYEVQNWCIHYKHFMTESESGQTLRHQICKDWKVGGREGKGWDWKGF